MNAVKEDDDEDEDAIPLADIAPLDASIPVFRDYIVLQKPSEPSLQLSRPQQMIVPSVLEREPPVSIGFEAFAARYTELEQAGLIDGSGQWPQECGQDIQGKGHATTS